MAKRSSKYNIPGQMPLVAQVVPADQVPVKSNVKAPKPIVIPIEYNSALERKHFCQSLMDIVPADQKSDEQVKGAIDGIYTSYYGVVTSTKTLAVAIHDFCELTRCTYDRVGTVMAKISRGLQKQLNAGYIGQLYHAGHALAVSEVADRLTDISKLALLGKLTSDEINACLTETHGQAMLGDKFISLLTRDQFKTALADLYPSRFNESKPKSWSATTFRGQVADAIVNNKSDAELSRHLGTVLSILDIKIKAADQAKADAKAQAKALRDQAKGVTQPQAMSG